MSKIYIVTHGANNSFVTNQFAFHDIEEAKKYRDWVDRNKGASLVMSTIHELIVYDKASEII